MYRNSFRAAVLLAGFALFFPSADLAGQQAATIVGMVHDGRGLPLAGAGVSIVDAGIHTITNTSGRFVLIGVPSGSHQIDVRHLGYADESRTISTTGGSTATLDFSLNFRPLEVGEVVVTGVRAGQASALQQQRSAVNLTNVVASDQIGRFPDANIGDALKRIPGINVMVDQGEARFGLIRGTEPRFNSVTINGERVPSAEAEVREVQLDLIPADMVSAVEVTKALTPEMDADAIGGAVNVVTRAAPASRRVSVTAGTGYNALSEKPIGLASFVFGDRFADGRLGVIVNGSYHDHQLGSDNIEAEWDLEDGVPYIAEFQIREYQIQRIRRSAGATLDWQPSATSTITWNSLYNWRDDRENRYRLIYETDAPDAGGIVPDATLARETKGGGAGRPGFARLEDQRAFTSSLRGEHLLGAMRLNWSGSYGRASEKRPDERYVSWEVEDVPVRVDISNSRKPVFSPTNPTLAAADRFEFGKIEVADESTWDEDMNGRINLRVPFGSGGPTLDVGLRARFKEKVRDNRFVEAAPLSGLEVLSDSRTADFTNPDFLAGSYSTGSFTTRDELGSYDIRNPALFELEDVVDEYGPANFDANERILAGFGQITHTFGDRLTMIGGVRVEATNIDYNGYEFNEDTEALTPTSGSGDYVDVLPGLHLRYDLDRSSLLRFAWSNTLARPNYYDLVPYRVIVPEDGELSLGNPDLAPTRSMNFDVMGEHYFSSIGLASAGVFYKRIRDFIFEYTRRDALDAVSGTVFDEIAQPANGPSADLVGFEVVLQRQLDFLPGMLGGLGIYANYTFTDSEVSGLPIEGRETETMPLPGSSKHTGNLSGSFEQGRVSLRASLNFASSFADPGELGDEAFFDRYYDGVRNLDLNGAVAVNDRVRIFVEGTNLTNQPLRYYQGVPSQLMQDEYYNWRFTTGLKYDF